MRQKRNRILVSYSLENGFLYKDNKEKDEVHVVQHHVLVNAKNAGTNVCYLNLPKMWLSKKINGERMWVLFKGGEEKITTELSPGEVLEKRYDLDGFLKGSISKLKDRHYLRFFIEDSIGNNYKSKKLRVKTLRNLSKRELEKCY